MDGIQYWSVTYATLFVTETREWGANNSIVSKNQSWSLIVHPKICEKFIKGCDKVLWNAQMRNQDDSVINKETYW